MAIGDNPVWLAHVLALVLTAATQAGLAAWIFARKWDQRGATTFVAMSLAGLAWTTSEIVLVVAIDPSLQEVAYLSGAFWATVATAAFVVFASRYSNASLHRNRLIRVALGGIVASYALLAPTNHAHHLLFEPFTPTTDPFPYLMYDRGPAIATMVAVLSLLGLYAVYRVGRYLLSTGRRAGSQLALLMAGALSVVGLEVASTLGLMPLDESTTPCTACCPSTSASRSPCSGSVYSTSGRSRAVASWRTSGIRSSFSTTIAPSSTTMTPACACGRP